MNTNLFCPKCATAQYIIDESNIGFMATGGDACLMCNYPNQNGDHQSKELKLQAARLALAATQNGNQMKVVMVYAILSTAVAFVAYELLYANHTIFGLIFSALAFVLTLITVTGLIFTPKSK